ncbi:MAG: gephyrin-like molybdotransferase Glp [Methanoregula sp.]|jgi:molybdopterin molybdotransferase
MSLFFSVVPVTEAIATVRRIAVRTKTETVPLDHACGRVLAEDIVSDIDIPGFTRSVMDGYAVLATDTAGASESSPAMLTLAGRVQMGMDAEPGVRPGECSYIPTGGILPKGTNAVVMAENTEQFGDGILVKKPAAPGENIIRYNEDFQKGTTVLPGGRRLSPQDLGVLAAAGYAMVPVAAMPRFGIISTGNELVTVDTVPDIGQVRDVNSYVIAAFLESHGCIPVKYGILKDDPDIFARTLAKAVAECDAVLISGGSSKDERDITAGIIEQSGEVFIHGVAIAPGKPTIIGRCGTVPVIGLPGHPAATFVGMVITVRNLIEAMTGDTSAGPVTTPARLATNVPSTRGREDYIRVVVKEGTATPLFGKSGLLNTLAQGNGLLRVPAESEGLEAGETVDIILL